MAHAPSPTCRLRRPRFAQRGMARSALALLLGLSVVAPGGCAAYRFGAASLFPPDIQTIYVPVFESDSFRRNFSELVTEAVIKEIELVTPYKVVGTPDADSVLTGKVTSDTKRTIIEDPYDQPREMEVNLAIEVRWVNRRGDLIDQGTAIPVPEDVLVLTSPGTVVAEFGQSVSTAQMQAIQRIATKVVAMMETPW